MPDHEIWNEMFEPINNSPLKRTSERERLELWCLGTDHSTHRKNEDKSPALHPVLMRAFHTCSLPKRWLKNSCFKKLDMWKRFLNPFCVTICWVGVPVMAQRRSALSQLANWNKLFALFPKTWPSSIMTLFNNEMMKEAQQKILHRKLNYFSHRNHDTFSNALASGTSSPQ